MAKRSNPVLAGSIQSSQDKLTELLQQADPGLGHSDAELVNKPTFVPENLPLMPTNESMSNSAVAAAARNANTMAIAGKHDPQYAGTLRSLEAAMEHTEKIATVNTQIGVGSTSISMPASVRDTPNALYFVIGHDRQYHYVRERADKLLNVLFGDVAPRVMAGAGRGGFARKPLLWVSQALWYKLFTAAETLDDLHFDSTFNPADSAPGSTLNQALHLCMEPMTIAQLIRFAKNSPGSVIDVLRGIITRILDEQEIYAPTPEETAAVNEEIKAARRPL